ncbi:sodium-independent anion transporter, partial [Sulfuricurvum sp.]|uniref:sodium-independent anion transporter n=1 Tax=Sulfuricurvum sp. TaxID=2025608 RepID=UPI002E37CC20
VDTLLLFETPPKVFILRMRYVPLIDAAGLHALEILHERLAQNQTVLILSGVNPQVRRFISQSHIDEKIGEENIVDHIDKAILRTQEIV